MKIVHWVLALALLVSLFGVQVSAGPAQALPSPQPPQPQKAQATASSPVHMDPAALPVATEPNIDALEQNEVPLLTEDPQAFAAAKKSAASASRGPQNAVAGPDLPAEKSNSAQAENAAGPTNESSGGPTATAPVGGTAFRGINEAGWRPADTNIAAGMTNLVEVTNSRVAVYGKNGAVLRAPTALTAWFGYGAAAQVFDPSITYRGGRFYLVALHKDTATQTSLILVSVSTTGDATGAWCNYYLQGEQAQSNWADFPRVGATSNKLLIATNQFRWDNGFFENNLLLELPKASLDACAGFGYSTWWDFFNSNGTRGFTINPALDYDAFGANAFYMVNGLGSGNSFTVWRRDIVGAAWQRYDVGTLAYSIPPDARQPGSLSLIATNDARVLTAVKRYNLLWLSQTVALNPGCGFNISAVHLAAINAPASTIAAPNMYWDQYYWADCNLDYYYPAAAPDGNGNMLFAMNRSSRSEYPNVRYSGWTFAQMPGQTTAGLFGSTRLGAAVGAFYENREPRRWGDYSGIAIDPQAQDNVWAAGMILQANNSWTTQIGRITHRVPSPL